MTGTKTFSDLGLEAIEAVPALNKSIQLVVNSGPYSTLTVQDQSHDLSLRLRVAVVPMEFKISLVHDQNYTDREFSASGDSMLDQPDSTEQANYIKSRIKGLNVSCLSPESSDR